MSALLFAPPAGNTVSLQYSSGVHRIASWSHLTNAHALPGDGIVTGLASVGLPLSRGLILLAQMSSAGMLATGQYTIDTVQMARRHPEFVFGFIAQERVEKLTPEGERVAEDEDFLVMTPGVGMVSNKKGDKLGQQYRTPRQVVFESGCDVIIVGRGIYGGAGEKEWKEEAEKYRVEGWKAYEDRLAV